MYRKSPVRSLIHEFAPADSRHVCVTLSLCSREPPDIIKWKDSAARRAKAVDMLEQVELPVRLEFLNRSCRDLSGGQRQRIAIACSLITEPRLLIADEITSMLDPSVQANIIRKMKELQNNRGFSMLFITHDLHLARKVADKTYVMRQGEIVGSGVPSREWRDSGRVPVRNFIEIGGR